MNPYEHILEQLNLIFKWFNNQNLQDTYITCIYSITKTLFTEIVDKSVMNKLMIKF